MTLVAGTDCYNLRVSPIIGNGDSWAQGGRDDAINDPVAG